MPRGQCKQNANLPAGADRVVVIDVDEQTKTIAARYGVLSSFVGVRPGPAAAAAFDTVHPELGCVLTKGPGIG